MAISNSYVKLPEGISPLFLLVLWGQKCGAPSDVIGIGRRAQQPGLLVMRYVDSFSTEQLELIPQIFGFFHLLLTTCEYYM